HDIGPLRHVGLYQAPGQGGRGLRCLAGCTSRLVEAGKGGEAEQRPDVGLDGALRQQAEPLLEAEPLPGRASGRVGHEEGDPERGHARPNGYSAGGGGSIAHASMGRTAPGQSPTYGPRNSPPAPELRSTTWKATRSFSWTL